MNSQETINVLNGLKLKGMSDAFASMVAMPTQERPGIEMGAAKMAEAEQMYRVHKRTAMFIKTGRLRYNIMLPKNHTTG